MNRPRILFLDQTGKLGGAELSLLDIAVHFGNRGRVVLFSDGPFRERLEAVAVRADVLDVEPEVLEVSRDSGLFGKLSLLPKLNRVVRQVCERAEAVDVLYANTQKAFVVAALAGRRMRKPVIWHLRDLLSREHFGSFQLRLVRFLSWHSRARVIANSKATAEAFMAAGGSPDRVRVVYNGFEPESFSRVDAERVAAVHRALKLNGAPIVSAFSRLVHWKGQHVLLQALPRLPHVHALLVGDALFQEDHRYAEALHVMAHNLGVRDRVRFLGFRTDIPELMKLSDVVLHTSISPEPFGRVIVEGMMAGRPVIATNAGGAREIVDHGRTGFLVEPGDPKEQAAQLDTVLRDPDLAETVGRTAQAEATRRFGLAPMLHRIEEQVREAAEVGA